MKTKGKPPKDDKWKAKYKEPAPPDAEGLPNLPEGWCWATLPMLLVAGATGMKTGPFGSLLKKHEHVLEGVPVVGIENIEPMKFVPGSKIHVSDAKAEALSGYDLRADDLVVSRSGTVGEVCVVPPGLGPARFSTNVMRVRFLLGEALPHFFALALNGSPFVRAQISELCSGTTREFLNQEILSALVFPVPPRGEQDRMQDAVREAASVLEVLAASAVTDSLRVARLRQAILKWAFEGKLVDQDPIDEPASVLLERIRAERAAVPSDSTAKIRRPRRSAAKKGK